MPVASPRTPGAVPLLGDVVIATGVARRQAQEAGHSYATELRVLALHGLLHLLGYDHHGDGGRMARVETRLRRKGGLPTGVIVAGDTLFTLDSSNGRMMVIDADDMTVSGSWF